jgi:hypothetical protein
MDFNEKRENISATWETEILSTIYGPNYINNALKTRTNEETINKFNASDSFNNKEQTNRITLFYKKNGKGQRY